MKTMGAADHTSIRLEVGGGVKLDQETIKWAESKIDEICNGSGHGYVALFFHIKEGKFDYREKIARETEKEGIHQKV